MQPPTLTSVKIWAEASGGGPGNLYKSYGVPNCVLEPAEITAAGGWKQIFQLDRSLTAISYFKKKTATEPGWKWSWKITEVNGAPISCEAGETSHDICVTAADPVGTPVFKWVMMASCKAADGQGSDTTHVIVLDVWGGTDTPGGLGTVARVDDWSTILKYGTNCPTGDTTELLLDHKENTCGSWANYFFDLCAAQGIGASKGLHKRGFLMVDADPSPQEIKWQGFLVTAKGINNTVGCVPPISPFVWERVKDNEYPDPDDFSSLGLGSDIVYLGSQSWWAFDNHGLVFLDRPGEDDYMFDPSFESGPMVVTLPSLGPKSYIMSDKFVQNYMLSDARMLFGRIRTNYRPIIPLYGYRRLIVFTDDFANPGATPSTLGVNWITF